MLSAEVNADNSMGEANVKEDESNANMLVCVRGATCGVDGCKCTGDIVVKALAVEVLKRIAARRAIGPATRRIVVLLLIVVVIVLSFQCGVCLFDVCSESIKYK